MPTAIEVVNMAIALLDEAPIVALTDNNRAARLANTHYDQVRRAELVRHRWTFAIAKSSVTGTSTGTGEGTLNYQYTIPAAALRVLPLTDNGEPHGIPISWRIQGDKILTDQTSPRVVRYIQDVTDPDDWSPLFVDVVAAALAVKMALPLTHEGGVYNLAVQAYQAALSEARRVQAFEDDGAYYDAAWQRWRGDNRHWRP